MSVANIKVGCEAIIINNNNLLLGKRKNCYGEGMWGLPGGHLEYGETIQECIYRELQEEVGINALDSQLISIVDNIDERGHYLHMTFILKKYTGSIELMEPQYCYEWKFFDLNNLPKELFKPHIKIIHNYLHQNLYYKE
ncbi:MAG: NUDIX domain-containing protein [Candidatus Chromulinivorax sp.]|nr:NUDIX domain-containing protein [Candidatus Chromulinivorax sp.]